MRTEILFLLHPQISININTVVVLVLVLLLLLLLNIVVAVVVVVSMIHIGKHEIIEVPIHFFKKIEL